MTTKEIMVRHYKERIQTINAKEVNALRCLEQDRFFDFIHEMFEIKKYAHISTLHQQILRNLVEEEK